MDNTSSSFPDSLNDVRTQRILVHVINMNNRVMATQHLHFLTQDFFIFIYFCIFFNSFIFYYKTKDNT